MSHPVPPERMWALVPLKSPERAKTRLSGMLSALQRRRLLFGLAARTIAALQATRDIDAIAVITASTEVADFAQTLGTRVIVQTTEIGTAEAFTSAIDELRPLGLSRLLMIAGDLPLISPKALELLCAPVAGNGVVVVPDHHRQGTNALLCSPPHALTPRFGRDSFRRHLAAARVAELQTRVLYSDTLSLDLDSPDDFEELRRRCASTADIVFTMMQGQYTTPALACA
ncbi:MAG TPA: 2-phospho-L-lactate guanylyltransferase [Solimonas sp.]